MPLWTQNYIKTVLCPSPRSMLGSSNSSMSYNLRGQKYFPVWGTSLIRDPRRGERGQSLSLFVFFFFFPLKVSHTTFRCVTGTPPRTEFAGRGAELARLLSLLESPSGDQH